MLRTLINDAVISLIFTLVTAFGCWLFSVPDLENLARQAFFVSFGILLFGGLTRNGFNPISRY